MDSRLDRRLGWAIAASLVAHGLALSPDWNPPAALSGAPLRASLRQPAATRTTSAPAAPVPERTVAPPVRSSQPEPVERVYEKTVTAPATASSAALAGSRETTQPAAAPGPQADTAAVAAPETPAAQAPRPTVDLNGLRQYYYALSRMAARFKRYPQAARDAGWEGRVTVRLVISETGAPAGLMILKSSGFQILDQSALEMWGLAASHTPIPEPLRGRAFPIDLVVSFSLEDDQ